MDYDEIADAVLQKNRAGEQVKKILAPPPVFYSIQSRITRNLPADLRKFDRLLVYW